MTEKAAHTRVLIPSEPAQRDQGYGLIRVYEATFPRAGSKPERRRPRVDIRRDALNRQSHYRIDTWTPADGCVRVTELLPEPIAMRGLPSYVNWDNPSHREACIDATERVAAQRVDDDACLVLARP
jgi:hypothetical protein